MKLALKLLSLGALLFTVQSHAQFQFDDHDGMYTVERQILCESQSHNPATCSTGLERTRDIYMARQISKASCIEGSSYSFYGDRIHVSNGCRAYFVARGKTRYPLSTDKIIGGGDHDGGQQGQGTLTASDTYPIGNGLYGAVIRWESFVDYGTGVVTVTVPDSDDASARVEKVMACDKRGQVRADWINPNNKYVFKLYVGERCPHSNYEISQMGRPAQVLVIR